MIIHSELLNRVQRNRAPPAPQPRAAQDSFDERLQRASIDRNIVVFFVIVWLQFKGSKDQRINAAAGGG